MQHSERQPRGRMNRRTALWTGIGVVVSFATHVPSPAHAQGVSQDLRFPGIQPRLIEMKNGYPVYEQVSNDALRALRDEQLRQSPYFDPNAGGTVAKRPECESTFWQTTSHVRPSVMEREYWEKKKQNALARQAIGQRAEEPGMLPHERVQRWKGALLPLTTEITPIRLELWTKDAAFNNLRTDRHAFYLEDFRALLKGTLSLPIIPNPDGVIFLVRWWTTDDVVLVGNTHTLNDLLKYGPDLLSVIDMTDPDARAQAAALAPNPLSSAQRATLGNLYLQGAPVCVPSTNAQK